MKKRKLWLAVSCLLGAAVMAVTGSYAWLNREQDVDEVYTVLSDFDVQGILSFGGQVYEDNAVMVPVSFRPEDANYIGKMKYVIRYQGGSPAYLRVRVLEQWIDRSNDEIMSASYLNYALSDLVGVVKPETGAVEYPAAGSGKEGDALAEMGQWVDNRSIDYCYYYSVPVQPKAIQVEKPASTLTGIKDGTVELTLIDQTAEGANTSQMIEGIDPEATQLMLLFEVEAVQPNRYREFFGIDTIPSPTE